jgi:hypothetical protein
MVRSGTGTVYRGYGPRPRQALPIYNGIIDASRLPEPAKPTYRQYEAALREPYIGITTEGFVVPGLFRLSAHGPSTQDMITAANRYLATLTPEQSARASLPVAANEWRAWTNAFPPHEPHGVLLDSLERSQRQAALGILEASLSESGFKTIRDVMRINGELAALIDDYHDSLKEYMYWLTIFGVPSAAEPWGWQIAGHHLDINCFIVGNQVVMTPTFLGAEPRILDNGQHAGTRVFDEEVAAGLALMTELNHDQRKAAVLSHSILSNDLPAYLRHPTEGRQRASMGQDNLVLPYEGICAVDMSGRQRDLLFDVIWCYISRIRTEHANARVEDILAQLNDTYFAWVGTTSANAPFYYKVHSPVVLIEFDCHSGVFLENDEPEQFHVHTIVRTPNGNDYGRDLLRQHVELHHRLA